MSKNYVQDLFNVNSNELALQQEMAEAVLAVPKAKRVALLLTWITPVAVSLNLTAEPSETGTVKVSGDKPAVTDFRNFLTRKVYAPIKALGGADALPGSRSTREKAAFDAEKIAKALKAAWKKAGYNSRQVSSIVANLA